MMNDKEILINLMNRMTKTEIKAFYNNAKLAEDVGAERMEKEICKIILQLVDMDGLLYIDELMEKIKEKR